MLKKDFAMLRKTFYSALLLGLVFVGLAFTQEKPARSSSLETKRWSFLKWRALVAFQAGGALQKDSIVPSLSGSLMFKVTRHVVLGPFYEQLTRPLFKTYPAVWIWTIYPSNWRSREETRPTEVDLKVGQRVIGLRGLYDLSSEKGGGWFLLGGGVGIYSGSGSLRYYPKASFPFKNAVGYHLTAALSVPIAARLGLLFSGTYHIVRREPSIDETGSVRFTIDEYWGPSGWETQIIEIDKRTASRGHNNFILQMGLSIKLD